MSGLGLHWYGTYNQTETLVAPSATVRVCLPVLFLVMDPLRLFYPADSDFQGVDSNDSGKKGFGVAVQGLRGASFTFSENDERFTNQTRQLNARLLRFCYQYRVWLLVYQGAA